MQDHFKENPARFSAVFDELTTAYKKAVSYSVRENRITQCISYYHYLCHIERRCVKGGQLPGASFAWSVPLPVPAVCVCVSVCLPACLPVCLYVCGSMRTCISLSLLIQHTRTQPVVVLAGMIHSRELKVCRITLTRRSLQLCTMPLPSALTSPLFTKTKTVRCLQGIQAKKIGKLEWGLLVHYLPPPHNTSHTRTHTHTHTYTHTHTHTHTHIHTYTHTHIHTHARTHAHTHAHLTPPACPRSCACRERRPPCLSALRASSRPAWLYPRLRVCKGQHGQRGCSARKEVSEQTLSTNSSNTANRCGASFGSLFVGVQRIDKRLRAVL